MSQNDMDEDEDSVLQSSPTERHVVQDETQSSARELIKAIANAAKVPARERGKDIRGVVEQLCASAYDRGLDASLIEQLTLIVAAKNHLDQSSNSLLIKNLYPAENVPSRSILAVVGALGQGALKPTLPSQLLLVKWLSSVYAFAEDPGVLSRVYSVLFGLLDMVSLRTPLCRLLALITRRKHVRPHRIQFLLDLARSAGSEPGIMGLLRVYKDYYPDVVLGNLGSTRFSLLSKPDSAWRSRLAEIQDANAQSSEASSLRRDRVGFSKLKHLTRSKSAIPISRTMQASESSVTIEEIESMGQLVDNLEHLEPPSQMVSVLKDPVLRRYMSLKETEHSATRLKFWLIRCFDDVLEDQKEGTEPSPFTSEILNALLDYTRSTKYLMPETRDFLFALIGCRDGAAHAHVVLQLLTYLPSMHDFSGKHIRIANQSVLFRSQLAGTSMEVISKTERVVLASKPDALQKLTSFYTDLLRNTMLHSARRGHSPDHLETFVDHVNALHETALESLKGGHLASTVLRHYEQLSTMAQTESAMQAQIILPSPQVLSLLALGSGLDGLSRLCAALAAYKRQLEWSIRQQLFISQSTTDQFNSYVLAIVDLLWRSRALSSQSPVLGSVCTESFLSALRMYLSHVNREYSLASLFGLSHSPDISSLSLKAFQRLEDKADVEAGRELHRHIGPVSQRTLVALENEGGMKLSWKDYRLEVLDWMDERGISGIKDFMSVTIKDLRVGRT